MAQQTTQAAGSGQTPPALLPTEHPAFWASAAIYDDELCLAFGAADELARKVGLPKTTKLACTTAERLLCEERNKSFKEAEAAGVLLFAWASSKALEVAA